MSEKTLHPRRTPAGRVASSDGGATLMEMVVAMAVTAILLAIVSTSLVVMFRSAGKSEAFANGATQVGVAFDRLDTSVRYANSITAPGVGADGNWYVEWSSLDQTSTVCSQLRLDVATQQLQQRQWRIDEDADVSAATSWNPLASGLVQSRDPSAGADPTAFEPPFAASTDPDVPRQQLTIRLTATTASDDAARSAEFRVTFTALNSQVDGTSDLPTCAEVGRS